MPESFRLSICRPEDLLTLEFELVNLSPSGDPPRLLRTTADEPALIIVHLPPQHVAERAFTTQESRDAHRLSGAVLAPPSRLVFRLPGDLDSIDLTLDALLAWERYDMVLPPSARPHGATEGSGVAAPDFDTTALELPYRIVLSPVPSADGTPLTWAGNAQPVTRDGRTELWHARIARRTTGADGKPGADERGPFFARAVWSPDLDMPRTPFATMSLTSSNRRQIVRLSSDFSLRPRALDPLRVMRLVAQGFKPPGPYVPRASALDQLYVSALGAWLRISGRFDHEELEGLAAQLFTMESFNLVAWTHVAAQGRDQYVRIEERGFVFPFGHRAIVVTVTERQMAHQQVGQTAAGAIFGATAHLRQRKFIMIKQTEKDYASLHESYAFGGREMPLRHVRIDTLVTPNLADTPADDNQPFAIRTQSGPFPFQLVGTDWDGGTVRFTLPLVFVPYGGIERFDQIGAAFKSISHVAEMSGQQLAFANDTGGQRGRATVTAQQITFDADTNDKLKRGKLPAGHPPFLPKVASAQVSIPAVEQFLGPTAANGVTISFFDRYLHNEANPGEVFAKIATPVVLGLPADKAGGLAAPTTVIDGLSRSLGPVPRAAQTAAGTFTPADVFPSTDATLLGGVLLREIIAEDGNFAEQIPKLVRRQLPDAVEVVLEWNPRVAPKPGLPLKVDPGTTNLFIRSMTRVALADGATTATVDGRLTNFAVDFLGVMRVAFQSLSFRAEPGKKTDFSAHGVDVQFEGALKFVNTLRDILPGSGFSDGPSLEISPGGIVAGYSLGVPTVGVGIFSLQNIGLSAALSLPFVNQPAGVRFAISERQRPFLVTVGLFGGGGFFSLAVSTKQVEQIEASIEFGGNISLNLGIASGGVYVMAGVYFKMTGASLALMGFLRCGGYLEVLGLISISIEFYLSLTYRSKANGGGEVWGQASVTVSVKVAMFSKSVKLTVERRFAGAAGDPTFDDMVSPAEFEAYCAAFA